MRCKKLAMKLCYDDNILIMSALMSKIAVCMCINKQIEWFAMVLKPPDRTAITIPIDGYKCTCWKTQTWLNQAKLDEKTTKGDSSHMRACMQHFFFLFKLIFQFHPVMASFVGMFFLGCRKNNAVNYCYFKSSSKLSQHTCTVSVHIYIKLNRALITLCNHFRCTYTHKREHHVVCTLGVVAEIRKCKLRMRMRIQTWTRTQTGGKEQCRQGRHTNMLLFSSIQVSESIAPVSFSLSPALSLSRRLFFNFPRKHMEICWITCITVTHINYNTETFTLIDVEPEISEWDREREKQKQSERCNVISVCEILRSYANTIWYVGVRRYDSDIVFNQIRWQKQCRT